MKHHRISEALFLDRGISDRLAFLSSFHIQIIFNTVPVSFTFLFTINDFQMGENARQSHITDPI